MEVVRRCGSLHRHLSLRSGIGTGIGTCGASDHFFIKNNIEKAYLDFFLFKNYSTSIYRIMSNMSFLSMFCGSCLSYIFLPFLISALQFFIHQKENTAISSTSRNLTVGALRNDSMRRKSQFTQLQ